MTAESVGRVQAIVVTHHPNREKLSALLDSIVTQVEGVVIVDNGSTEAQTWLLEEGARRGCQIVPLEENIGVAGAHNIGIEHGRVRGVDAVLLLDQDSVPDGEMMGQLSAAFARLESAGDRVGAVGPCQVDHRTGAFSPFVRFGFLRNEHLSCDGSTRGSVRCEHLISSGTLMPLAVLDDVGAMDESLFIDGVDTEWSFRAISRGYKLFGVCGARMRHSLGEQVIRTWVPRADGVVVHSPVRLYYIVRNHVLLYRRGYVPFRWKVQDALRLAYKVGVFSTSISPRLTHLSVIVKALLDGIRGKAGPMTHRGAPSGASRAL